MATQERWNGASARNKRRRLGLTLDEVAREVKCDTGALSRWERGFGAPQPETAGAIKRMLDGAAKKARAS